MNFLQPSITTHRSEALQQNDEVIHPSKFFNDSPQFAFNFRRLRIQTLPAHNLTPPTHTHTPTVPPVVPIYLQLSQKCFSLDLGCPTSLPNS